MINQKYKNREFSGVGYTMISAALWGVFPIIVHRWTSQVPIFFFAAITGLFACAAGFALMVYQKKLHELRRKEAYFPLFMVSVCIIFIPGILFFWGASLTSAVNTSVLMLSEIIFTLIFTPFFGEKNTIEKYLGSIGIMIGAALVLYKGGGFTFCFGDFLVAISTITFPIGNFYSKRSLYIVSPSVVITMRYLMGGIMLLIVSFIYEPVRLIPSIFADNWIMLFLTGFVLLALCKIAFYEGMKRLDISKVISLEMTYPFFSLLTLILVFNETLYLFQILGVCIMVLGAFYTVKRKSVTGMTMKYVPKNMRES